MACVSISRRDLESSSRECRDTSLFLLKGQPQCLRRLAPARGLVVRLGRQCYRRLKVDAELREFARQSGSSCAFFVQGPLQIRRRGCRRPAQLRRVVARLARQIQFDVEIGNISQIKVLGRKGDQLRAEIYAAQRQSCSDQGRDKPSAHPRVLKRIARLFVFLILRLRYWRPMCRGDPDWPTVFPDPLLRRRRPMCDVVSRLIILDPDFLSVSSERFQWGGANVTPSQGVMGSLQFKLLRRQNSIPHL